MINLKNINEYLKAIKIGFDCYGLNGFYDMEKSIRDKTDKPWGYDLTSLNELSFNEFELLCNVYLTANKK